MKKKEKIGFIGVGIIGASMVQNLLNNKFKVNISAHKNRSKIKRLVALGATELHSLQNVAKQSDVIILCLPDTATVTNILDEIFPHLSANTLIIDSTTNKAGATEYFQVKAASFGIRYAEAPLTGGKMQADTATLGAIVGCDLADFKDIKSVLQACCTVIERFGNVGSGAKVKLISNFLALGTATLVVETMKAARDFSIDPQKFYEVSCQGAGHSVSLDRIVPKAIKADYTGYEFSISNTLKDFSYIREILHTENDYGKLAKLFFEIYQSCESDDSMEKYLSERLDPKKKW